jgi:hypothetical protein
VCEIDLGFDELELGIEEVRKIILKMLESVNEE